MDIQGISANDPIFGASAQTADETLGKDAFLQLLVSQLQNQDPLEPNDTQALLEQLSAIRSIESETKLTDSLTSLVERDEFATAAALIGREVRGLDESGLEAAGVVKSVSQTGDGVRVNLADGRRMEFGSITEVLDIAEGDSGDGDDGQAGSGGDDEDPDTGGSES